MDVMRDELVAVCLRFDGSCVLVQDIDLFEGESLGLRNEEVCEDETSNASRTPDEKTP